LTTFDYPLILKPVAIPRPWGGGRLPKLYGRETIEASEPIGESWDVSTWPRDPGNPELPTVTTILNGPLSGTPLDQVVSVPVVVKLLDTAEKLSVQIHPVSDNAHKDEMWYILYAEPDAYLFCGLNDGVTGTSLCELVKSGDASQEAVLNCLKTATDLKPGMYFNVPSGTVHAVGPGLVAFEVSECMQVTYRLYDYNRGRALHIEDGCNAMAASRTIGKLLDPKLKVSGCKDQEMISHFPTFSVVKITGSEFRIDSCSHMHLLTATMGDITITGPNPLWNICLKHASTCLVPATTNGYDINVVSGDEVLITALKD